MHAEMPSSFLYKPVSEFKVGDEGWISPHYVMVDETTHLTYLDGEAEACTANEENRLIRIHKATNGFHLYLKDTHFCFQPYHISPKHRDRKIEVSEIH